MLVLRCLFNMGLEEVHMPLCQLKIWDRGTIREDQLEEVKLE